MHSESKQQIELTPGALIHRNQEKCPQHFLVNSKKLKKKTKHNFPRKSYLSRLTLLGYTILFLIFGSVPSTMTNALD